MKKVLTIGGATQDVFLESAEIISKNLEISGESKSFLLIPESEKIDISSLHYATGGGSTNCAVSFKKLGFDVEAFFKVGKDNTADFIIKDLKSNNIDISNISRSEDLKSGISFILPSPKGDRTVLVYRGSSASLKESDLQDKMFANKNLVYIAPLSGDSSLLLLKILKIAKSNGSIIALNPSKWQLEFEEDILKSALKSVDIFVVNHKEAKVLSQKFFKKDISIPEIIKKILDLGPKVVVVTAGKSGVYVGHENKILFHKSLPVKVINTVGAGDAFASCFVGVLVNLGLSQESIKKAVVFGLINSASVISFYDAKEGLLDIKQIEEKFASIGVSGFEEIA